MSRSNTTSRHRAHAVTTSTSTSRTFTSSATTTSHLEDIKRKKRRTSGPHDGRVREGPRQRAATTTTTRATKTANTTSETVCATADIMASFLGNNGDNCGLIGHHHHTSEEMREQEERGHIKKESDDILTDINSITTVITDVSYIYCDNDQTMTSTKGKHHCHNSLLRPLLHLSVHIKA